MNKEVKELWLKALKSGEYQHGTGDLRIGDTYCCLGVLCDLHRKISGEGGEWKKSEENPWYEYLGSAAYLPEAVSRWSGINRVDGIFYDDETKTNLTLSSENDNSEDFSTVIDYIEKYF